MHPRWHAAVLAAGTLEFGQLVGLHDSPPPSIPNVAPDLREVSDAPAKFESHTESPLFCVVQAQVHSRGGYFTSHMSRTPTSGR